MAASSNVVWFEHKLSQKWFIFFTQFYTILNNTLSYFIYFVIEFFIIIMPTLKFMFSVANKMFIKAFKLIFHYVIPV